MDSFKNNFKGKENRMSGNRIHGNRNKLINGNNNIDIDINKMLYKPTIEVHFEAPVSSEPESLFDQEYSENYYNYIKKFEELEGYLFEKIFRYKWNTYSFSSNTLNFAKELLNWVIGYGSFPIDRFKIFQREIGFEYNTNDNEIAQKRWQAMNEYFSGNIQNCMEIYQDILSSISDEKKIEQYYKDDILIDGLNLENQIKNMNGTYLAYLGEGTFSKAIRKNKHMVAYPICDRLRNNIYELTHKNLFQYKSKGKNTITFGVDGINYILNEIQKLIYITVLFGSITHLKLCRELIANVLFLYGEALNDDDMYLMSLKTMALANNNREFESLFYSLKNKTTAIYNTDFINELLMGKQSVLEYYKDSYQCLIYKKYGNYFEDGVYLKLEEEIMEKLKNPEDCSKQILSDYLEAISYHLERFKNKEALFDILLMYTKQNYSKLYRDIARIINIVDLEELSSQENQQVKALLNQLIPHMERYNLKLLDIMIKNKLKEKTNQFDAYIFKNKHSTILYNIYSEENHYNTLKYIYEVMNERAEERERDPKLFHGYATDYTIGRISFSKKNYTKEIENLVMDFFIPLSERVLSSKNQTVYEKVRQIRILTNLLMENNTPHYKSMITTVMNKINFESAKSYEPYQKDDSALYINQCMIHYLLGKISFKELLDNYYNSILKDDNNMLELLECLDIIEEKIPTLDLTMENQLYTLWIYSYHEKDLEVKCLSYSILKVLLKSKKRENLIKFVKEQASTCTFDEAREIVILLRDEKFTDEERGSIKALLLENHNYNIKKMTEKYING